MSAFHLSQQQPTDLTKNDRQNSNRERDNKLNDSLQDEEDIDRIPVEKEYDNEQIFNNQEIIIPSLCSIEEDLPSNLESDDQTPSINDAQIDKQQNSEFSLNPNRICRQALIDIAEEQQDTLIHIQSNTPPPSSVAQFRSTLMKKRSFNIEPLSMKTHSLTNLSEESETSKIQKSFEDIYKMHEIIGQVRNQITNNKQLIIELSNLFTNLFELHNKKGAHSIVRRCTRRNDQMQGVDFAVKIIAFKDLEQLQQIEQEKSILSLLQNDRIMRFIQSFILAEQKKAYLVTEFAKGYTLTHLVASGYSFQVQEIQMIITSILEGVNYLHSLNIIHRDLSSNNIIFDPISKITKIIDFTTSKNVKQNEFLLTNTGTLDFKAPEMLSGCFQSYPIDLWAVGINLYFLVFKVLPFSKDMNSPKEVVQNIIHSHPLREQAVEEDILIDWQLKDLLKNLLQKNPEQRPTSHQALAHSWKQEKKQNYQNLLKPNNRMHQQYLKNTITHRNQQGSTLIEQIKSIYT